MPKDPVPGLVRRIRKEFPDFSFTEAKLSGEGVDHIALKIDRSWIFRFRKPTADTGSMEQELGLLAVLRHATTVRVPNYEWVSRKKDFGGYRAIPGIELTARRFAALAPESQLTVAKDLGTFLSALHGLPESVIYKPLKPLDQRYPNYYTKRYWSIRRPVISPAISAGLLGRIDAFYQLFLGQASSARKVIHVDIKDKHILLSTHTSKIAGVLDFTDATLWDPARDFAFLWGYGPQAVEAAYGVYAYKEDSGLIARSLWQGARLFIDRIYYDLSEPRPKEFAHDVAVLENIFDLLPTSGPAR